MLIAGTFFGFGWNKPLIANAATAGDFTITATDGGTEPELDTDYSYASNVLTILSTKDMTISGTTITDTITTTSGLAAVLTINNVSIDGSTIYSGHAFNVDGGSLHLTLKGANVLKGTGGAPNAGLNLVNGANLTIDAESGASLNATGGSNGGAGIGGGISSAAGNITINGGNITATGTTGGAGIGGGHSNAPAGEISINYSEIEASGGSGGGAGIGGGMAYSAVGEISINYSEIEVTVSGGGAGIGGGNSNSTAGNISIYNSEIEVNTSGTVGGAGIGGGNVSAAGDISIDYSEITANNSGQYGAGIGGGFNNLVAVGVITINNSEIIAKSGQYGAGIGGGFNSATGNITITGSEITATGGATGGAGIGGGRSILSNSTPCNITINSGTITATSPNNQDIGNGYDAYSAATSITINGGSIWATNGKVAYGASPTGPKNSVGGGERVYPNTLTLGASDSPENVRVEIGIIDGTYCTTDSTLATGSPYGIDGVKTNASGQVCFWLPQNSDTNAGVGLVTRDSTSYESVYTRTLTSETQTLAGVFASTSPTGTGEPLSGNVVLTFSTEMNATPGTVELDIAKSGSETLTGGTWSSGNTIFTIPYSDLNPNTEYNILTYYFKTSRTGILVYPDYQSFTTGAATPLQKVQSVTITGAPAKFAYKSVGVKTLQLRANVLPTNATNKTVTWKSSNAKIATVNAAGLVTFTGTAGSVAITTTAVDGSGKSAQVTIKSTPVFDVTFKNHNGKVLNKQTVEYGEKAKAPKKPTRKGYKFAGWYTSKKGGAKTKSGAKITASTTLYAHWTANKYTVKFKADGGKVSKKSKKVTFAKKYGALPKATKKNKTFVGWYTKKSGGTKVTSSSKVKNAKSITLYAHWKNQQVEVKIKNCYYVWVHSGPGNSAKKISVFKKDATVEIIAQFGGWYKVKSVKSTTKGWVYGRFIGK
jgi:uncharacterized repeat protein (TIGR02543 family)